VEKHRIVKEASMFNYNEVYNIYSWNTTPVIKFKVVKTIISEVIIFIDANQK